MTEVLPPTATSADDVELEGIDALRVLRADTPEQKSELLEQIAGSGKVEQDIVSELSKVKPLWRPDEFEAAHRMTMRALEVLDRNGARKAKMPRLRSAHAGGRVPRAAAPAGSSRTTRTRS